MIFWIGLDDSTWTFSSSLDESCLFFFSFNVKDVKGYHKAIYAADNADNIAQHFYEQGKSDAVRELSAKSKNISMTEPRSAAPSDIKVGGYRIKAVSGLDSSKLKIKTRKFN